ncbi:hypothetical protein [Streptosporangium sp. NPDC006007]|uniref:hypothetical protein n=1 Tax=Streptosporangium sp. NPDC006007 TaxID=3154575 RepID=UPI0033AB2F62
MATVSRIRPLLVGLLVAGATVGGLSGRTGPARADTDTGSTTANVQVNLAITLSDLSPSFTLTGAPGATVTTPSPVTMRVTTNSFTGYAVTVQPAAPALTGDTAGNTDTIPMTLLEVSGPAQAGAFTPLSLTTPVEVVRKTSASAADGDVINHDYRITIPAVRPDIYRETINYIATTL